ncbi:hypothetical protein KA012_03820 [Candidatus Woesebacteria bacterium]|nr:hypothetical protein [Candidatus Woesebacteria bacterium]
MPIARKEVSERIDHESVEDALLAQTDPAHSHQFKELGYADMYDPTFSTCLRLTPESRKRLPIDPDRPGLGTAVHLMPSDSLDQVLREVEQIRRGRFVALSRYATFSCGDLWW